MQPRLASVHRKLVRTGVTVIVALLGVAATPQAPTAQANTVVYVDASAPPGGDGQSWANAFRYLQDALLPAGQPTMEVRIAQGVYQPDQGAKVTALDSGATFQLPNGVSLIGGFAGRASATPDERDPQTYETHISGDLRGDDGPGEVNRYDNSDTLFCIPQADQTVLLDGLTITGAALRCLYSKFSNVVVVDCVFRGNRGVLDADESNTILERVRIAENNAFTQGKALVSVNYGTLSLLNSSVSDNLYTGSRILGCWFANLTVQKTTFAGNEALNDIVLSSAGEASLIDCVFQKNQVQSGSTLTTVNSTVSVERCRFDSNRSVTSCGAVYLSKFTFATIRNCRFQSNISQSRGAVTAELCSADFIDCGFDSNLSLPGVPWIIPPKAEAAFGAFYGNDSQVSFSGCVFTRNQALAGGGAITALSCTTTVTNCVLSGNSAPVNGALYGFNGTARLLHCLSADNISTSTPTGPAIYWGYSGSLAAYNSIFWDGVQSLPAQDNITAEYCCIQDHAPGDGVVYPGTGNIDAYPEFLFTGAYHLNFNSPCIDAGGTQAPGELPELDIEGGPRVVDGNGDGQALPDIGPHEYNPVAACLSVQSSIWGRAQYMTQVAWEETILIGNCGGGTLNWTITGAPDWLSVFPEQGSTPAGQASGVQLFADLTGARPGRRVCELQIHSPDVAYSPRILQVTLDVVAPYHVPWVYPTIQAAVDAAPVGEAIYLAEGTYRGIGNRDVDFKGKSVTLTSENGPAGTIIDCQGYGGLKLIGASADGARVDGLTIMDAGAAPGVLCQRSSPTVSNCVFRQSGAVRTFPPLAGGLALELIESNANIIGCSITGHQSLAIASHYANPRFQEVVISDNHFSEFVANFASQSKPVLSHCTITGNSGGSVILCGDLTLSNCLVEDNTAQVVHGAYGGLITIDSSTLRRNGFILKGYAGAEIINSSFERTGGIHISGPLLVDNSTFRDHDSQYFWPLIDITGKSSIFASSFADIKGPVLRSRGGLVLQDCTAEDNSYYAAGVFMADKGDVLVTNCGFRNNSSTAVWGSQLNSLLVSNSVFTGNYSATSPGGIDAVGNDLQLVNCVFSGNQGLFGAGGARLTGTAPVVVNCTFTGNRGPSGPGTAGGLFIKGEGEIVNTILWANEPIQGAMLKDRLNPGGTLSYCIVQDGEAGFPRPAGAFAQLHNSSENPLFIQDGYWAPAPPGGLQSQTWVDGNFRLLATSPGVDAGDSAALPPGVTVDHDGLPRVVDNPARPDTGVPGPNGAVVDIGAYEYQPAAVMGRYVFYNNSAFDGWTPGPDPADDGAIATDKQALMPGLAATVDNYLSYSRGINGIMLDVGNAATVPTAADFEFMLAGADGKKLTPAPAPASLSVRWGAGEDGSDRITLIWPDNAIPNSNWLRIKVKSDLNGGRLGLLQDDVFYIGLAIGETLTISGKKAMVNSQDVSMIRQYARKNPAPPSVDCPFDINRDGAVDALDEAVSAGSATTPSSCLLLPAGL